MKLDKDSPKYVIGNVIPNPLCLRLCISYHRYPYLHHDALLHTCGNVRVQISTTYCHEIFQFKIPHFHIKKFEVIFMVKDINLF